MMELVFLHIFKFKYNCTIFDVKYIKPQIKIVLYFFLYNLYRYLASAINFQKKFKYTFRIYTLVLSFNT